MNCSHELLKPIPDSLASVCNTCGQVFVDGKPWNYKSGNIKEWAKDLHDQQNTKPCVVCEKELSSICDDDWQGMQPNNGCEIQIIGAYGSTKFDLNMSSTVFKGVICDDCAEKLVVNMEIANEDC